MRGWAGLTLVTDADLGAIEPQAIAAGSVRPPWGQRTWPEARAEAKREVKILVETTFPDVPRAADRVLDVQPPDAVLRYDGSTYTDLTTAAVDPTEDDVDLATIFATGSGKLYLGADYQFDGIAVVLKDSRNAAAAALTAKYSGAAGFAAIPDAVDGTAVSSAAFAQSGRISWPTVPAAWTRRIVSSLTADPLFWVELSLSASLAGTITATQILTVRAPDGLKRVATLLALSYILNGLERQAGKPSDWQDKAAYYREQGLALFQLLKERGGIPVDRNRDAVVTEAEVIDTTPVRLQRG